MGTCTPADWVHLQAARFSLKAEQLRQRTPSVVFYMQSVGDDSALLRVALLDTDLLPPPLSLVTVALVPLIFLLFQLCGFFWWLGVSDACSN